ncbi:MAG: N-6 DNA methylase [Bacteroidales bacterium]|nr:N-6 DNA methylase [Bacteroidales bacterium]
MEVSPTIQAGIDKGIIELSSDGSRINYVILNKSRSFTDPEEKVQAETYISLVITYGYPIARIDMFVKVQMGSETKEADIIVYADDAKKQPLIIVECKKNEISEAEFKKAVDQAYSYAYALAGTVKYLYITSGLKSEFYKVNKDKKTRETITTIPFFGKDIPLYKYVKGGRLENEQPDPNDPIKQQYFDIKIITENDLTHAFLQAHQALWAGGQLNPSEAFDELDKLIFCKIWDERKPRENGEPYDFQIIDIITTSNIDKDAKITSDLYKRILNLYEEGRKKDKEVFRDDIRLTPQRVRTIVGYLQGINLSKTDLDSKGRAFETFMGSYFRGDFGQFFTPRKVVDFIVKCLPINNESKVLDSSCGSGGFLLFALDKVRKQADKYYKNEPVEHFRYWHDFAEKKLFGMEINEQIARSAKMNMIIHDDGHTNVISTDGLLKSDVIIKNSGNTGFEYDSFDFIITNPPFGSIVKQQESSYLHQYGFGTKEVDWLDTKNSAPKNRDSQSTEVLFIEQDFNFLKDGGFLAIVIPDGILTNSSLQYVRDKIMTNFRIVAVVSLPQTAFAANGAGVKSSVLFLRKLSSQQRIDYQAKITNLQTQIKKENNYLDTVAGWDVEKKTKIKTHEGFTNNTGFSERKEIEKTDAFKNWKREINEFYNQKLSDFQDKLNDILLQREKEELINYQIFMAIAEQIGYDATGKTIAQNDLDEIAPELEKFINSIIKNEKIFFLNNDKFFLINRNELEGRWDPEQCHSERIDALNKIKGTEKYLPLSEIASFDKTITTEINASVVYIGLENIESDNGTYIKTSEKESISSAAVFQKGDVLFPKLRPYLNKVFYATFDGICSTEFYVLKATSYVLPEFLAIFLRSSLVVNQTKHLMTGNTLPRLQTEDVKKLLVPIPSLSVQQQIVDKYNAALRLRRVKLALSKQKLASIDTYLLSELGISLPKDEVKKMFLVDYKEVVGKRLDPYFHKPYFSSAFENLKGKYDLFSIKQISLLITSGITPLSGSDAYTNREEGIAFVRSGDIDINGNIDFDNLLYIKSNIHNTIMKSSQVQANDIMIAIVGATIGRIGIYYSNEPANINQAIALVRLKENYLPDYIKEVLQSSIGQLNLDKMKRPVARANINLDEIGQIILPIPPLDKQQEIANHITAIRAEAKALEIQAEEILAKAREEVEKMILGK